MNSYVVVAFAACLAVATASWSHGPSSIVLQGPSSRTSLVGPEGSVISAHAPGGQIVHEEHPGVVAYAAPEYSHIVAHAAPALAHAAPVVAHHSPVLAHSAPSTVVAHSSAYEHDSVVVAGPSGTIATGQASHAAPVVAHSAPFVAHAAPIVAHSAPVLTYGAVDVHGHEGEYVLDHNEALYDDGSYKPHLYHH